MVDLFTSDGWVEVAGSAEIGEGELLKVSLGERSVVVARSMGRLVAYEDECPHKGAPLSDGVLHAGEITCPWHHARFDARDGSLTNPPALDDLGGLPVEERDGRVFIRDQAAQRPEFDPGILLKGHTFAIVGAGAAGLTAAEELRRRGFGGRLVVLSADPDPPYDRTSLSKAVLAGETGPDEVGLRTAADLERLEIELKTGSRVDRFDPSARRLVSDDGQELDFDAALLAPGSSARTLDVPGADLPGVHTLRSLGDARRLTEALASVGKVIVVGDGFIGLEAAAALTERELEVEVIARDAVPLHRAVGSRAGMWLLGRLKDAGVSFRHGGPVKAVAGTDRAEAVVLEDGSRIEGDLVLAGIGARPQVGWLEGSGLVERGAIPVNERLQTPADFVFAAGDVASYPGPDGEAVRIEHWSAAQAQGRHAARAMLGNNEPFNEPPFFWTRQLGVSLGVVGHPAGHDQHAVRGSVAKGEFVVGLYRAGRIVAVAGVGRDTDLIAFGRLLRFGPVELAPKAFGDLGLDPAQLLEDMSLRAASAIG